MKYGWRGRIGLLVPSTNRVIENDFHRMIPPGVSVHTARMKSRVAGLCKEAAISTAEEAMPNAVPQVMDAKVDIVVFGVTSASYIKGKGYDQELIRKMETIAGVPATTSSTAVVNGLKFMEVRKVAMATPYPEDYDRAVSNLLVNNGFDLVKLVGGQLEEKSCEEAYRRGKEADTHDADCVFISCTDFETIDIIEDLERDLSKPVMTVNQATVWDVLKRLKIGDSIDGYGSLLKKPRI